MPAQQALFLFSLSLKCFFLQLSWCQMWPCTPVIQALGRWRQEDREREPGRWEVVRSICCSCREPECGSQHSQDGLQQSVTPVPGDPNPLLAPSGTAHTHGTEIYVQVKRPYILHFKTKRVKVILGYTVSSKPGRETCERLPPLEKKSWEFFGSGIISQRVVHGLKKWFHI